MAVILAQLRQLPAFWACQEQCVWNNATRELVATGQASVGALDDLEVSCKAPHDSLQLLSSTCNMVVQVPVISSESVGVQGQQCARISPALHSDQDMSASGLQEHQHQLHMQQCVV